MRFGIALPNFRPLGTRHALVEMAQQAEALGYDSIWATDIVVQTRSAADERFSYSLEALTVTAYLAALTTRVQLGISVLVLPQRSPVLVAKEAATLDCLSGGRLVLGVGAGYHEMQFRWLGADFRSRGQRLDEYIRAMRQLWSTPEQRFDGQYVAFSDVAFSPRPVQPQGPPIVIGGSSPAALRRVAQLADGWHPVGLTPAQYAAGMRQIHALANGRQVEGSLRIRTVVDRRLEAKMGGDSVVQVSLDGSPAELGARIEEYQAAGVGHLVVYFEADDLQTTLRDMQCFAAEVCPAFRQPRKQDDQERGHASVPLS
jgi:probable F420-dependent oxidoreductase